MKNIILKLFDKDFVLDFFNKEVLKFFPEFDGIDDIEIKSPKKLIWEDTYHVVIEFKTVFVDKKKEKITFPIYCSAHSEEPRRNVYKSLKYLWENGFDSGDTTIPKPLFYSDFFNATFYVGVEGFNLYYYIRHKEFKKIEEVIPVSAKWFANLHATKVCDFCNFNKENSRIKTVIPGREEIIRKVGKWYPELEDFYKKSYDFFIKKEKNFLKNSKSLCLVHGDAHPENIIRVGKNKIAVIDFTDLCLTDFARDLGCFLQQFSYMANRKIEDSAYSEKMKKVFLDNYFKYSKRNSDNNLEERIDSYYYWTALRTATFFLIKNNAEPERAMLLVKEVKDYLAKIK